MSHRNSPSCDEENYIGITAACAGPETLDFVSLPRTPLNLDQDHIFAAATDYENWTYSRYTLKDLPPFDNSALFGITVADENANIREEIGRLARFVDTKKAVPFNSYGALGETNDAGFENLFNVVDQILCNFEVIRHDNASLALDHYLDGYFYDVFKYSRRTLRLRYLGKQHSVSGHTPITLTDEKDNMQAYHALIDFIFQSLAWWLVRVAEKKSWRAPIIAVLARWSVKLKLIALDPVRWAEMSLTRGEDVMRRISHEQNKDGNITFAFPSSNPETERKKIYFPEDRDVDYQYYTFKFHFRENLYRIVRSVLTNLKPERSDKRSAAFEVRTLVYRGRLDETLRHLTVQRDGTVGTSSDVADLRRSHRALQLLLSNVHNLGQTKVDPGSLEVAEIKWYIKQVGSSDPIIGSVTTTQLDDVISAMVPLSLTGSSQFVKTLDNPLIRGDFEDDYPPAILELSPEGYRRIEFSLSTRQSRKHIAQRVSTAMMPSSKSPLIAFGEDEEMELEDFDAKDPAPAEIALKRDAIKVITDYKARKAEIKSWAVTEDSVLVRTSKYSGIVLTVAMAIIGGTLSIPFLVGNRITGVDPFQFVTFGWLLAGAFLVGAKSRYVENWPWHDFLRGQVVCRSVSELSVASRVRKQAVLLYLLHHEFRNPLVFRGPYNGVFRRRVESGAKGFNIDAPTAHSTVLAAGFIVLEVFNADEEVRKVHTILQDTREDAPNREGLVFEPVEDLGNDSEKQKSGYKKTVRLKVDQHSSISVSDYKVLGLPTTDCNFI